MYAAASAAPSVSACRSPSSSAASAASTKGGRQHVAIRLNLPQELVLKRESSPSTSSAGAAARARDPRREPRRAERARSWPTRARRRSRSRSRSLSLAPTSARARRRPRFVRPPRVGRASARFSFAPPRASRRWRRWTPRGAGRGHARPRAPRRPSPTVPPSPPISPRRFGQFRRRRRRRPSRRRGPRGIPRGTLRVHPAEGNATAPSPCRTVPSSARRTRNIARRRFRRRRLDRAPPRPSFRLSRRPLREVSPAAAGRRRGRDARRRADGAGEPEGSLERFPCAGVLCGARDRTGAANRPRRHAVSRRPRLPRGALLLRLFRLSRVTRRVQSATGPGPLGPGGRPRRTRWVRPGTFERLTRDTPDAGVPRLVCGRPRAQSTERARRAADETPEASHRTRRRRRGPAPVGGTVRRARCRRRRRYPSRRPS